MANPEHLSKILEGVKAWNCWRESNPNVRPNLDDVDFMSNTLDVSSLVSIDEKTGSKYLDFSYANFSEMSMRSVNVHNAKFFGANFCKSELGESIFISCHFLGAKLKSSVFYRGNLSGSDFWAVDLRKVNFVEANLHSANFLSARLQGAHLKKAKMQNAIFVDARLQRADLTDAWLLDTNLQRANLEGANVTNVKFRHNSSKQKHYQGIRLSGSYGSQIFKSFAQDQDYIEEFRELKPFLFKIWWVLANCGRSFCLWAGWSLVLAVSFGFFYYMMGINHIKPDPPLPFSLLTMMYYSVVTFTTLGFGDVKPQTELAALVVMAEVIIGYIMLGGLISILANKLARRS
jgi:uncharacterized protein YjbI with pentapeptide repeats